MVGASCTEFAVITKVLNTNKWTDVNLALTCVSIHGTLAYRSTHMKEEGEKRGGGEGERQEEG